MDFGDGCSINDRIYIGILAIDYARNTDEREILITYNLINFSFNEVMLGGTMSILREIQNDNGNRQFTLNLGLTATFPDGRIAERTGEKIRELIEGGGNRIFSDNVFEVTGNWKTTFRNGNTHTYQMIEFLRREVICLFFVSGSVDVQRTNFGGILDYGEDDCDNVATFTYNNGTVREIVLD